MATPPRVSRAEVDAACARIHWRHTKVDDPRRSGLSDDPGAVLEHLGRHSTLLPPWVIAADALDGLVLLTWLWWEDRRRERALLRRGLYVGLTHRELGTVLGVNTRQGLRDRLDRLEALLAYTRPDEKITRTARREAARAADRRAWAAVHAERIDVVVHRLFAELDRVPELASALAGPRPVTGAPVTEAPVTGAEALAEAGEWLAELRADQEESSYSPATLSVLGLVLGPLRLVLRDIDLNPNHGLWRALRDADRLRAELAEFTLTHSDEPGPASSTR